MLTASDTGAALMIDASCLGGASSANTANSSCCSADVELRPATETKRTSERVGWVARNQAFLNPTVPKLEMVTIPRTTCRIRPSLWMKYRTEPSALNATPRGERHVALATGPSLVPLASQRHANDVSHGEELLEVVISVKPQRHEFPDTGSS